MMMKSRLLLFILVTEEKFIDKNHSCHWKMTRMDSGNYWRLENGKIDSSFSTVLQILERMNISIKEFIEKTPVLYELR